MTRQTNHLSQKETLLQIHLFQKETFYTSFDTPETKTRELNGLIEAMKTYSLPGGSILTNDSEEKIVVEGLDIQVLPVWKWILQRN